MNSKRTVRVILDMLLTVMIVVEMFIQFTGVFLHEVIGFAFFATVAIHLALSAKWIKGTAGSAKKKKLSGRRAVLAVMGILLAVNMVVLGVSSVAISTILSSAGLAWTLGSYALWSSVHAVSSYTLCALVTLHLGMHWVFVASIFNMPYDPSRRQAISTGVHAVAAAGAVALGVMAVNQVIPSAVASSPEAGSDTSGGGTAFGAVDDVPNNSSGTSSHQGSRGKGGLKSGASETPSTSSQGSTVTQSPGDSPSGSSSSGSSSAAAGICTLCHEQCPLSAPRCNKPYQAGLL